MSDPQPATSSPQSRPLPGSTAGVLGAVLLLVFIYVSGAPALDADWLQGDEQIFIAANPDVTGAGRSETLWQRVVGIFSRTHDDLYQPLTIATYAMEWSLWGEDRARMIRQTDVLIHALNAMLVWAALAGLLGRFTSLPAAARIGLAWCGAAVWAMHPALAVAYAADMGRTHLLATTFLLASLLCHLRALPLAANSLHPAEPPAATTHRPAWFAAALVALLLAMLNKALVGWVVVVAALEAATLGWRAALRSPRVYAVLAICAFFAALTLWTSARSSLLEDAPPPLFGDPLARAAVGMAIYLRSFFAPGPWLSFWYPPDPSTSWTYPPVWAGTAAIALILLAANLAARQPETRGAALGLLWFLGMWLPASDLVGTRVQAAQDRYLYQPAIGLILAALVLVAHWLARGRDKLPARLNAAIAVAALIAVASIPLNTARVAAARDTIDRARSIAEQNPDDPRVLELLARAYVYELGRLAPHLASIAPPPALATQPDTASSQPATQPATQPQAPPALVRFQQLYDAALSALAAASSSARDNPRYFSSTADAAAHARRLSFQLWALAELAGGDPNLYGAALGEAQRAHELEPDSYLTWTRLAHAYRSLGRLDEARQAYEQIEKLIPPAAPDRGLRMLEHATLYLSGFNDPAAALPRFRAALQSGSLVGAARTMAQIGLARCEIMAGQGVTAYHLLQDVLMQQPDNPEATVVLGLYHLRSHHFREAADAYAAVLSRFPVHYEALRGLHEACSQLGDLRPAADAWQRAAEAAPGEPIFVSFLVWALACVGDERAGPAADRLVEQDPPNQFGHYSRMLVALRAGRIDEALAAAGEAAGGEPLPLARESWRAHATLRLMLERGELPAEAAIVFAAVCGHVGQSDQGRQILERFLAAHPDSPWRQGAESVMNRLEAAEEKGAESR